MVCALLRRSGSGRNNFFISMIYFVSDIHLGLKDGDVKEREERFTAWLKSIEKPETEALYLLGDIWDFWYEYRDVIPNEGVRVIAAIVRLLDAGVKVYYVPGNHDVWLYSFWQKLGVEVVKQPIRIELKGKRFLLGHGDGLGGADFNYRLINWLFHNRTCQVLFSTLHPWLAYRFGTNWSNSNRRKHRSYKFKGADEQLYKFCVEQTSAVPADYCIFGHFHDAVDISLPTGARLIILKDWIDGGEHYASWDGSTLSVY